MFYIHTRVFTYMHHCKNNFAILAKADYVSNEHLLPGLYLITSIYSNTHKKKPHGLFSQHTNCSGISGMKARCSRAISLLFLCWENSPLWLFIEVYCNIPGSNFSSYRPNVPLKGTPTRQSPLFYKYSFFAKPMYAEYASKFIQRSSLLNLQCIAQQKTRHKLAFVTWDCSHNTMLFKINAVCTCILWVIGSVR